MAGRIAGRRGRLYVAKTSAAAAEPLNYLKDFNIDFSTEQLDATAFGDTTKVYVTGLPDAKFSGTGFWDQGALGTLGLAQSGDAARWYFYFDTTQTTQYLAGTAYFDARFSQAVNGIVEVSINGSPASSTFSNGLT